MKQSRWFFWWNKLAGGLADYVYILVDMDGHPSRAPSM
jgi:hypothetical protein